MDIADKITAAPQCELRISRETQLRSLDAVIAESHTVDSSKRIDDGNTNVEKCQSVLEILFYYIAL